MKAKMVNNRMREPIKPRKLVHPAEKHKSSLNTQVPKVETEKSLVFNNLNKREIQKNSKRTARMRAHMKILPVNHIKKYQCLISSRDNPAKNSKTNKKQLWHF